jgi:hypothetical protein
MTWNTPITLNAIPSKWVTAFLDGEFFKLVHHTSNLNPSYFQGTIAQAQVEGTQILIYDLRRIKAKSDIEVIQFKKPACFSQRLLAFKADQYSYVGNWNWAIEISASDATSSTPAISTKHAWWRVRNTVPATGGDGQWIVRELRFLSSTNQDLATGGTPVASGGSNVTSAFDKNEGSFWPGTGNGTLGWIGYQWPTPVEVKGVQINNLNNGYNIPPTGYVLEWSDDGLTWTALGNFTAGTNDNQYYTATF